MSARFATFQATIGNDRNGEISALDALARNGRFRREVVIQHPQTLWYPRRNSRHPSL
jgi:hypothetical protein